MDRDAKKEMDNASGGALMESTARQAMNTIERMSTNSRRYLSKERYPSPRKDDRASSSKSPQSINNDQLTQLMKKLDNLTTTVEAMKPKPQERKVSFCETEKQEEEVNFMGQRTPPMNPSTRAYDSSWPRKPTPTGYPARPPINNTSNYQRPNPPPNNNQTTSRSQNFYQAPKPNPPVVIPGEDPTITLLNQVLAKQDEFSAEQKRQGNRIQTLETHTKILDTQIAQQASTSKAQGKLPAQPDHKECNALSTKEDEFDDAPWELDDQQKGKKDPCHEDPSSDEEEFEYEQEDTPKGYVNPEFIMFMMERFN